MEQIGQSHELTAGDATLPTRDGVVRRPSPCRPARTVTVPRSLQLGRVGLGTKRFPTAPRARR